MKSPSKYYHDDIKDFLKNRGLKKYFIYDNTLAYIDDIQNFIRNVANKSKPKDRIVVISFNFLWKPILNLATKIGFRTTDPREPNWLSPDDIQNMFYLEGVEEIKRGSRFLFPIDLGFISLIINKYLANLPLINKLCLTNYQIFKRVSKKVKYSVSIIIPARNESENIKGILEKIPRLGTKTEVIFVEGGSKDNTYTVIENEVAKTLPRWLSVALYKQSGKGKKNAVRLGFSKAKNDILMILDADLTVKPIELKKFYNALANGYAEFANGSRLVYPLEKDSMRTLNYFGNKVFSLLFTFLLNQRVKDTLCGTKALFCQDYKNILKAKILSNNLDPFGDFDLLFGAVKQDLKIIDVPVRYYKRGFGTTNISRFKNGMELIKMTYLAAKKIKFI